MSRRVLVIKSSARGEQSASNQLVEVFKTMLGDRALIRERDVGTIPLPVLDGELLSTFGAGRDGLTKCRAHAPVSRRRVSEAASAAKLGCV